MKPSTPLESFVEYCNTHIRGDEKGEAQTFLDRFFTALGHTDGHKGAGAAQILCISEGVILI
ncbi:MAG TPA: hypothetical protein PK735_11700, partial [Flavobacteriales bacterium]|nr:hypothetical protein [Flavobacteriales bacterium]